MVSCFTSIFFTGISLANIEVQFVQYYIDSRGGIGEVLVIFSLDIVVNV